MMLKINLGHWGSLIFLSLALNLVSCSHGPEIMGRMNEHGYIISVDSPKRDVSSFPYKKKRIKFVDSSKRREPYFYYPRKWDFKKKIPLILSLHSHGNTSKKNRRKVPIRKYIKSREFALLIPEAKQGTGGKPYWNVDENCCNQKKGLGSIDQDYLWKLIEKIKKDYPIEEGKIFIIGHSAGGLMAYSMVCHQKVGIAGVAVIGGSLPVSNNCAPNKTSLLHIHGTKDEVFPYGGSEKYLKPLTLVQSWAKNLKCPNQDFLNQKTLIQKKRRPLRRQEIESLNWYDCDKNTKVSFWTVKKGKHTFRINENLTGKILDNLMTHEISRPQYPMVFHHGIFGFKKWAGIEYFKRLPQFLMNFGIKIFPTAVDPFGNVETRAKQLGQQIDEVLKKTGKAKVNIVAHSLGGIDSRYLISGLGYGDRIASLTTISSPHRGAFIAQIAMDYAHKLSKLAGRLVSYIVSGGRGEDKVSKIIEQMTPKFMSEFNLKYKNDPRVYYQSWAGVTSSFGINTGDMVIPIFFLPQQIIFQKNGVNDGVISVMSAKWGKFRGTIPADHLDEMGLRARMKSVGFNHHRFYRTLVFELAQMGH